MVVTVPACLAPALCLLSGPSGRTDTALQVQGVHSTPAHVDAGSDRFALAPASSRPAVGDQQSLCRQQAPGLVGCISLRT
jgi:hypothetical protein